LEKSLVETAFKKAQIVRVSKFDSAVVPYRLKMMGRDGSI
jgi:hypothetical protein